MRMKDVDQTDPHTNQPFWATRFEPAMVADGGRERDTERESMEEVEHESPNDGTDRSFHRGDDGPVTDE